MDNRTRQDTLVGLLRARGSTTVDALAQHFSVSQRTIHRDLAALRSRAIPVESELGRGGGVHLNSAWSVPPVRFDLAELVGLIFAVSLARQASTLPFSAPAEAALAKVMAALPSDRSRQVRRLCRRVLVGPPASAGVLESLTSGAPKSVIDLFERAFTTARGLGFTYVDRDGNQSRREAEPHGLLVQPPVWYLLAFDLQRQAPRTFRLDRMSRPQLLQRQFTPRSLSMFEDTLQHVKTAPVF